MILSNSFRSLFLPLAVSVLLSAAEPVTGPLVVSDRWPECTDLVTWTRDVMRLEGLEKASETAQGKAFFRWLRLFNRMATGGMIQAHEGEYGKERYILDSHKHLFIYGWGYCDTTSRIAEAAWVEFKKDRGAAERVCVQHPEGGFHTMYRLRLDGGHGAFDPRYGYYVVERDAADARVLDWDGVGVDGNILRNKTYRHRSAPFFEFPRIEWQRALDLRPAYYESQEAWEKAGSPAENVFGNAMYKMGTRFHDMDFRFPRGTTIERFWDNSARKFYVPAGKSAQREEPFLPSGRFYRVTETMFDGNWVKHDPNYQKCKPYVVTVPRDEGYNQDVSGGRTIGQAWGRITYKPDLRDGIPTDALAPGTTFVHATAAPFLRSASQGGGEAVFDVYSPYVLVDGVLSGELSGAANDGLKVEIRALRSKPQNSGEPDVWSTWDTLYAGPGEFSVPLGKERHNGRQVSIHGVYRFQIRISAQPNAGRRSPAGLNSLKLGLYFENAIMSIPQIFAGRNTIRFKVRNSSELRGPVTVAYRYQTATGERSHERTLRASDFHDNVASYVIEAPGLERCNSLTIQH
ncbi:MAG TPA: hypothetical protein VLE22_06655 [Bryobacteraceae bacterium]|nr:hypothetical protein [Bryobacteraceae bacterium]